MKTGNVNLEAVRSVARSIANVREQYQRVQGFQGTNWPKSEEVYHKYAKYAHPLLSDIRTHRTELPPEIVAEADRFEKAHSSKDSRASQSRSYASFYSYTERLCNQVLLAAAQTGETKA